MSALQKVAALSGAISFAAHAHRFQVRDGAPGEPDTPYINHSLEVLHVLVAVGGVDDLDAQKAAVSHDVLEDTDTTRAQLAAEIGESATSIVDEVSDDKALPKAVRKQLQVEHAAGKTRQAKAVSLADKICNLRDLAEGRWKRGWTMERAKDYFVWAAAVYEGLKGEWPLLDRAVEEQLARGPMEPAAA